MVKSGKNKKVDGKTFSDVSTDSDDEHEDSDSSSSSDTSSVDAETIETLKREFGKSHRHKRSALQPKTNPQPKPQPKQKQEPVKTYKNFFV